MRRSARGAAAFAAAVAAASAAMLGGCDDTVVTVLPLPIPVGLTADGGAGVPYLFASVDGKGPPFPMLVDTGTVLTAYDDHLGTIAAHTGDLRLFGVTPTVLRMELDPLQLFILPLSSVGPDGDAFPVSGIFAGDNLLRAAAAFDFRPPASLTITPQLTACSCELALDDCQSVFNFGALAGGAQGQETDPRIVIGNNLYSYPATRVILDLCLEPLTDPVSLDRTCAVGGGIAPSYLASGVDVKVVISSGFPGLGIGAGAYDRLRGPGAADSAIAQSPRQLHLPDLADDGVDHSGLTVGQTSLGDGEHSALALVSREVYFGPCSELARSRRVRRFNLGETACAECRDSKDGALIAECCGVACGGGVDCDSDPNTTAASSVEFTAVLPALVVPDLSPLLTGINADVRPLGPTIEGVIGSEVLSRLVTTIDYQNARVVARCSSADDCISYARYSLTKVNGDPSPDCEHSELCASPAQLHPDGGGVPADCNDGGASPSPVDAGVRQLVGGACPPAPPR